MQTLNSKYTLRIDESINENYWDIPTYCWYGHHTKPKKFLKNNHRTILNDQEKIHGFGIDLGLYHTYFC